MKCNTLKIFFYACIFSIVTATASQARDVTLQWDPSADTSVTGYKVNYNADSATTPFSGTGSIQGASPYDAKKVTTATLTGLDPSRAYYFAVTAYNASGTASSYSNVVTVSEAVPPTVSITSPAANATISGTVSVTASATDNVGVTKVEYYLNGALKTTDTSTPYVYSLSAASLASGTYTLMAKAYDAAGNVGQSSTVSVTVVNDTTAPTVSLTSPANNATVSGTTTITASASDNVGVSKVEFYRSGVLLSASNVAPFSYGWNTTTVANGSYTLTVKAYDNTGNVTQSTNVLVTVKNSVTDTAPPTISSFLMPTTSTTLRVPITAFTGSDNVGVTAYCVTSTNSMANCDWLASPNTSFAFGSTGTKAAYAWVKDAAGNVSASKSATVNIGLADATAPTVSVTVPANNVTVSGTVSVTASASDKVGVSKVEFYVNNVLASTDTATPFTYSWNTTTAANGVYTLTAKAYDAAGNVGQSAAVSVTVKNSVPNSTTDHQLLLDANDLNYVKSANYSIYRKR